MKNYKYKKYTLSKNERVCLKELLDLGFAKIDSKHFKAKLWKKLSKNFDTTNLDNRLTNDNRLTLLGLYLIDPHNYLIMLSEKVIKTIKSLVLENPDTSRIKSNELSSMTEISQRDAQIILQLAYDFGFFSSATGMNKEVGYKEVSFSQDSSGFDKILSFKNLDESLEKFFNENVPNKQPLPRKTSNFQLDKSLNQQNEIWDNISKDYDISKRFLGKKINFITDKYRKKIIFRDIEHSYLLFRNGYVKPAVILAGSIIEELLRLYLISKDIKPKKHSFDEYVKLCEENNFLTKGIGQLSDSVRLFRNLVHLEKEGRPQKAITKSIAQGAVSSVFTLINDFS